MGSGDQKTGGSNCVDVVRIKDITGQLQSDEFIIRQVTIQSVDHPVSIRPEVVARFVVFEAVAFAKSSDIQPVPRPAFAIVRRRQQTVDEIFVGLVGWICQEFRNLLGSGRKSEQIETQPSDQRAFVGLWRTLKACVLQPCIHKRIDGGTAVADLQRLQRPPVHAGSSIC